MADKQTATVTIEKAVKKENGWYEGTDGYDRTFSTKKPSIGGDLLALEGELVDIEFTVQEKGEFTNRYLESIKASEAKQASPGAVDKPALGTGEYIKGQTAPSDARGICASTALNAAVASLGPGASYADTANRFHQFFLLLAQKRGIATREDEEEAQPF